MNKWRASSLCVAAAAAFVIARGQAAEPGQDLQQDLNACTNGQMAALLGSGYDLGNPCTEREGTVKLRKVATVVVGSDVYELNDFAYSFRAAVVRHGGARLLVLKNGRYVGEYSDATGGQWQVHGTHATVAWPTTGKETQVDLSAGIPESIETGDGNFTLFQSK